MRAVTYMNRGNFSSMASAMLLLFVCLLQPEARAQSCCCTGAGANYSILPNLNRNVAGLRWTYSYLYSDEQSLNPELNGRRTHIRFHTAEVFGRFNLSKHWQLSAFVPVNFVTEKSATARQNTKGLGDISLMMQYLALDPQRCSGGKSKHQLRLGAGFKLPSGKHHREDNNLYSTSLQPGTGSTDFFFNAIYTYRFNDFGLNLNSSYRANTVNSYRFRFGDRLESGAGVFYIIRKNEWTFMPGLGFRYMRTFRNYHRGEAVYRSGSDVFASTVSWDVYYRRLAFSISAQPVAYNRAGVGDVTRRITLETGLFYNF